MKKTISFLLIFAIFSCSYAPILDDNYKYQTTDKKEIDQDIKDCEDRADAVLKEHKMKRAGKEAVRKGVIGTIFGAVFGFFIGGNSRTLVKGAAIGAGVGAAVGGGSVLAEGKLTPDQMRQNYVSRCLNERGYSVLGWE